MLETIKEKGCDVVIGSRYMPGGGTGSWDASRAKASRFAAGLIRFVVGADLSDPMSWFLPAVAGILVGAGWNHAVTRQYVWRQGAP
jgi:dolichol-phosphate mannosyltransferase